MKKIISTALFGIAIGTGAMAQDNLSVGPTAGFGHTWMSNSNNAKYQPAGNVGLSMVYSPMSHWGFGADLKWSIEGGKTSTNNSTTTTRLDYIRIPLKAMYFFGDYGDRLRPKLTLGPSVGFLVGGNSEFENNTNGVKTIVETKAKDFAKSIDLGIATSAGFNYRLVERTWLNVDVNYYHGLSDVMENVNINQRNRNIGVNVGVTFGIGKLTPEN